jgi:hypothetical protein
MYIKDQRIAQIDAYYWQIETLVDSFQASCRHYIDVLMQYLILDPKISALLNIRDWQTRNDAARAKDQDELITRLDDLERNQHKLLNVLSTYIDT